MKSARLATVAAFVIGVGLRLIDFAFYAMIPSYDEKKTAHKFAELYSYMFGIAEHSISVSGFAPLTIGDRSSSSIGELNRLIARLWEMPFGRISPGGSSGALLTTFIGVLPKVAPDRSLVLIDCLAHQSAFGALGLARFEAAIIERRYRPEFDSHEPLRLEEIRRAVETFGADRIAAVLLVTPSYDGFRDVDEEQHIVDYLRAKGIFSIFDAAWGSACTYKLSSFPAFPRPDILISSPHKKSLTVSSHGVILTTSKRIAEAIDETGRCGTVSTSPSYVTLMVSEFRLQLLAEGRLTKSFLSAQHAADCLRCRIKEVDPRLFVVTPRQVGASHADPSHLLINTIALGLDARAWAKLLYDRLGIVCEKSTHGNLLLLVGSDMDSRSVEALLGDLRIGLLDALHLSNTNESFDHGNTQPT